MRCAIINITADKNTFKKLPQYMLDLKIPIIDDQFINHLIEITKHAGQVIMEIYRKDFQVTVKDDLSPLTSADLASNNVILKALKKLTPDIPIVSEESTLDSDIGDIFWLVDPLDGTKEFIAKTNEFTINIGLIVNARPLFGVIHVPALQKTYWGGASYGSSLLHHGIKQSMKVNQTDFVFKCLDVISSKSHLNQETISFINQLEPYQLSSIGSSLKFCKIAEGLSDIYPRFAPTMEWDTAAGQAIAECAGKKVIDYNTGLPLTYNKENLLNPSSIVQ
jgi:3'(2'), 5'-bisphosphate nucleotidase